MARVLVLDDDPERHDCFRRWYGEHHDYFAVMTAREAIAALGWPRFDVVFLDHDLGDFATGYDVAQFIVSELPVEKRPEVVVIHSWNPAGAQRMFDLLRSADIKACLRPFSCAKPPVYLRRSA